MYPIGHMNRNKQIAARDFRFGMNSDVEELSLPPGWYREARNMEGAYPDNQEAKSHAYGNRKINYSHPAGDGPHIVLGSVENREGGSLIYFVYDGSDNENHAILEYSGGQIKELLRGPLGFQETNPIHSAVIVENVLYWCDGLDFNDEFGLQGSAPKRIDIGRFRPGKYIRYELILNADAYLEGVTFSYSLYSLDGTLTQSDTFLHTVLPGAGRDDVMLALFNALGTNGFFVDSFLINTTDRAAPKLSFSYGTFDKRVVISVSGGAGDPEVELNELNFYPLSSNDNNPDIEKMISLIRPTPLCPPSVKYAEDPGLITNNLHGSAYQFRYRYVFHDNQKSAWGPASRIPTNFKLSPGDPDQGSVDVINSRDFNKIVISIDEDDYVFAPWRWLVRKVEVAFRTNRDDSYKLVGVYDLYEFTLGEIDIDFTNNGIRQVIPSDDLGPESVQSLKNYDAVPKIAGALERIYDKEGNSILALFAGIYGNDTWDITATLVVENFSLADPDTGEQVSSHKGLKRGGVYKVGVVYKDDFGRMSSAKPVGTVEIPPTLLWSDSDYEVYNLRVEMNVSPPVWATSYQIVISENRNQEIYWQASPSDINRYNIDSATGELTADINGIYYGFEYPADQLAPIPNALAVLFENLTDSTKVFIPEVKDRIQIYKIDPAWTGAQTPVNADTPEYNYEIEGYGYAQTGDPVETTLVVLISIKQVGTDIIWSNFFTEGYCNTEVYRPKKGAVADIYYEFGPCSPIDFFAHLQINLRGYGDTYTTRGYNTSGSVVFIKERGTLHPESVTPENDLGRAVAYDADDKEKYHTNLIRGSDPFVQGSSINGLNAFREGDYISVPESIGPGKRLVMNQNVLLAIGSFKTQPIYIAKDRLLSLNASFVGRTDQLFNIADEVKFDMGTLHPLSVIYEQGATYGWDARTGRYWRYTTGSGQFPISDYGLAKVFQSLPTFVNRHVMEDRSPVGFDRKRKSLYVSNTVFTAIFKEVAEPHWVSYADFFPEAYGRLNRDFFSFKDGQLYIHDQFATPGKYFEQDTADISLTFVVNDAPEAIKLFDAIEVDSNKKWYAPQIRISSRPDYLNMRSKIPVNKWSIYEGSLKAEFMRDALDPSAEFADIVDPDVKEAFALLKGRPLRGRAIEIKLELTTPGETVTLRRAYVYYQLSRQTVSP